jgi:hypothetical protein
MWGFPIQSFRETVSSIIPYLLPWTLKKLYLQHVYKTGNIQDDNFPCGSVWVWNLVSDIKGET